jgi:3-hydroxyisobutyrate dehydrogenase
MSPIAQTVAFIGLGNMGGGMAANLVKAGYTIQAFDLSAEALSRAVGSGCRSAMSARAAVQDADIVVTMLPAGAHVRSVYADTIIPHAARSTLLIDSSTIDVATARSVAADALSAGLDAVDAPVSGGIAAAQAGTLTFMAGGTEVAYLRAVPVLKAMGKTVIRAGSNGAGQAAKIANNMLLGATMAATCEAFVLAQKLGLDPQKFYDIASISSGQSWSMTSYCPLPGIGPESPADRDYQGGFAATLMLKDLKLALDAANHVGAEVPMGKRAAALYDHLVESGQGEFDFSALIKLHQTNSV